MKALLHIIAFLRASCTVHQFDGWTQHFIDLRDNGSYNTLVIILSRCLNHINTVCMAHKDVVVEFLFYGPSPLVRSFRAFCGNILPLLWQYCHNFGSIARDVTAIYIWILLAVLPQCCQTELLRQYLQKLICMRNPVLPQYCGRIARLCCSNIAICLEGAVIWLFTCAAFIFVPS